MLCFFFTFCFLFFNSLFFSIHCPSEVMMDRAARLKKRQAADNASPRDPLVTHSRKKKNIAVTASLPTHSSSSLSHTSETLRTHHSPSPLTVSNSSSELSSLPSQTTVNNVVLELESDINLSGDEEGARTRTKVVPRRKGKERPVLLSTASVPKAIRVEKEGMLHLLFHLSVYRLAYNYWRNAWPF